MNCFTKCYLPFTYAVMGVLCSKKNVFILFYDVSYINAKKEKVTTCVVSPDSLKLLTDMCIEMIFLYVLVFLPSKKHANTDLDAFACTKSLLFEYFNHVINLLSPGWCFSNLLWMRRLLKHPCFLLNTTYSCWGSQGSWTPTGRNTPWAGHTLLTHTYYTQSWRSSKRCKQASEASSSEAVV